MEPWPVAGLLNSVDLRLDPVAKLSATAPVTTKSSFSTAQKDGFMPLHNVGRNL